MRNDRGHPRSYFACACLESLPEELAGLAIETTESNLEIDCKSLLHGDL